VTGARAHNDTKSVWHLLGELYIFSGKKEHRNWEEGPNIEEFEKFLTEQR
jgi:hypothetical protein